MTWRFFEIWRLVLYLMWLSINVGIDCGFCIQMFVLTIQIYVYKLIYLLWINEIKAFFEIKWKLRKIISNMVIYHMPRTFFLIFKAVLSEQNMHSEDGKLFFSQNVQFTEYTIKSKAFIYTWSKDFKMTPRSKHLTNILK